MRLVWRLMIIIPRGDNNAPHTMVQGARVALSQGAGLAHGKMVLVVIGHALAQHLHRLELLEHDRLATLGADPASHEVCIVALRQRGARRLGKLALLRHLVSLPLVAASLLLLCPRPRFASHAHGLHYTTCGRVAYAAGY